MANLFQTCSLIQARLWAGLFIASLSIAACQFTAPAAPAPAATAIAVAMTAPSTAAADDVATIAAATIEAALKSTLPAELAIATPTPPPTLAPPALDFAILDEEIVNGQAPLRGTGQPGVDVLIVVNGNIVAVAKVQPDGQWSKMVAFDQPGKYSVSVQAMDAAGQQSVLSTPLQLVVAAMPTPTYTPTPTPTPSATATNTPIPTATLTATRSTPEAEDVRGVVIDVSAVNIRELPTEKSSSLGVVRRNKPLTIYGKTVNCRWYYVGTQDGRKGWIFGAYVRLIEGSDCRDIQSINAAASPTANPNAFTGSTPTPILNGTWIVAVQTIKAVLSTTPTP